MQEGEGPAPNGRGPPASPPNACQHAVADSSCGRSTGLPKFRTRTTPAVAFRGGASRRTGERRVGEEGRSRGGPDSLKKKKEKKEPNEAKIEKDIHVKIKYRRTR